jgi:hypothetical protein
MSSLAQLFVPAALTAGGVFSAFAVPLTLYGSQPLTIQLREERVFEGQLRDAATPYLAIAGILSLGTSLSVCAVFGWKRAAKDAEFAEAQLLAAEQHLKQKEAQLQDTLMSETYLADSGLKCFLDENVPLNPAPHVAKLDSSQLAAVVPTRAATPLPVPATQLHTTAPLHAAQAFLSFSRPAAATQPAQSQIEGETIAKMQTLQSQLQQIMAEIETIQSTLRVEAAPTSPMNNLAQRFQALDPAWRVQK